MKTSIKQYVIAVIIGLGLVVGVSSLQAAWTLPTGSPPNGNVDAPINTGYTGQIKQGGLWVKGLIDASTPAPYSLVTENSPLKASGGLIIETRTSDPTSPETGRMWLRTDL